jgi:hypothetical protein
VLQIHWFSIINSCVTVLLLTGFLTTILLRVLKNDFLKYTSRDDEAGEPEDETGWKYLHGDVFRWGVMHVVCIKKIDVCSNVCMPGGVGGGEWSAKRRRQISVGASVHVLHVSL